MFLFAGYSVEMRLAFWWTEFMEIQARFILTALDPGADAKLVTLSV